SHVFLHVSPVGAHRSRLAVGAHPGRPGMSPESRPRPPAGLRVAGKALWKAVVDQYELAPWELHLLEVAATHKDLWSARVRDRSQRGRAEARAEAIVVSRLLRELRLTQAEENRPPDLAGGRRG